LDLPARKLYWADTGTNPGEGVGGRSVCRGDFDGSTPLEILATGSEPWDVDLDLRCTNYQEWVQRCFRRDALPPDTAPEADPDQDGLPNAVEYAFDTAPQSANTNRQALLTGRIVAVSSARYHAVVYPRRTGASDLQYQIETSTNLNAWTPGLTQTIDSIELGDGLEAVTARTTDPVTDLTQHFMRVRVVLTR
jgi:hypothetical protein